MPVFDVLCLPSVWEGLGLVLVEAMLAGVPAIGSNAGAIPEVLGNGLYGWIFNLKDGESLREIIKKTSKDIDSVRAMGKRAKEYAQNLFTIQAMTDSTTRLYKKIMDGSK